MKSAETVIIGAGASGLAAAVSAARAGERILVLEKMNQPGKKLLATGNGRCNLMNRNTPVYYGDPGFAGKVLGKDPVGELTAFWKSLGLWIRYDAEGRGYPCTGMASTVMECLKGEIRRLDVPVLTGSPVRDVSPGKDGFRIRLQEGEPLETRRVILATGGAAQPRLGGNEDAWPWLRRIGHTMVSPTPALTPLRTDRRSVSGLAGLRVKCELTVLTDGKPVHREKGELLFSDSGVSGICVMQCARFVLPGRSEARINLVSGLFDSSDELIRELFSRRERLAGEEPEALLRGLCAPKMAYAVCRQAGFPLRGELIGEITEGQIAALAGTLREYRVLIEGPEGFDRSQVMAGGLACGEVDPSNMESRICPGLHVTGELLNVDGDCGGYNLMFAFLSGIRAGANRRIERGIQGE